MYPGISLFTITLIGRKPVYGMLYNLGGVNSVVAKPPYVFFMVY